jgi:glycosyltransferase involved in cell wall biosynthesis
MRVFLGPLGRVAYYTTDTFIGISKSVVKSMPKYWQRKAEVVYNGIDFQSLDKDLDVEYFRRVYKVDKTVFLVGIVGSLVPIKGHKDFIEMASILSTRFSKIHFVVIGDAPEVSGSYKLELLNLCEEKGLNQSFYWTGKLENASRYIGGLDVLASATQPPGEGFGLTLIEAMGQGVPVVSYNNGAEGELVLDGETGFLVDSPKVAAEKVLQLLADDELYKTLSDNAKIRARELFSISNTVKKVEKVYSILLGQSL